MATNLVEKRPLYIGLCDDEKEFIDEYRPIIDDVMSNEMGLQYKLFEFTEPGKLLNEVSEDFKFDILLLDIMFKDGVDGRDLAERIRVYDLDVKIIFVSNEENAAETITTLQTSGYIKKSSLLESTRLQLTKAANIVDSNYVTLKVSDGYRRAAEERFYLGKVVYLEVEGRLTRLYKFDKAGSPLEMFLIRMPLKDIGMLLKKDHKFLMVNRNTLVNIRYIQRLDVEKQRLRPAGQPASATTEGRIKKRHQVILRTGQRIDVGTKFEKSVILVYSQHNPYY